MNSRPITSDKTDQMPPDGASVMAHISSFTAARYTSEALFAIRGLVLAKLFGPLTFGLWTQMRLVQTFLQFIRLGTSEALLRDFPYHMGSGDFTRADLIKRVVSGFNLITTGTAFVVVTGWLVLHPHLSVSYRFFWLMWLVVFGCSQIYWFAHCQLQAEKRFFHVSKMISSFALLSTAIGLISAYYFDLAGFLAALLICYTVTIFYAGGWRLRYLSPVWNTTALLHLVKTGFPIMASNALFILLLNIDKIAIWLLMEKRFLGIYAVQAHITNFIMLAPGAVAMVLFPSMMEYLGQVRSPQGLEAYLKKPTQLLCCFACPLLGFLYLGLHLPIKWLLPEYALSIVPGKVLVLASFFLIVARMPAAVLVSINKQTQLALITLAAVFLSFCANVIMIRVGHGLIGAATASACGFVAYAGLTLISAFYQVRTSFRDFLNFQLKIALPFILTLIFIFLIERVIPESAIDLSSELSRTAIREIMFLVIIGLPLYAVSKRLSLAKLTILPKYEN
jgi:O-antigen/teichoic acid export membrane protein